MASRDYFSTLRQLVAADKVASEELENFVVIGNAYRRYALGVAQVAVAGILVLSGCSQNTESDLGAKKVSGIVKVDGIASNLPEALKQSGELTVGVSLPYMPNEFKDSSGRIIGFGVDLMDAVSTVLGLEPKYVESPFEKIIPNIQVGTYDVGLASMTDSKEREKQVDFTTYFRAGTQWAQQVGSPVDPTSACGKKVAVQATTLQDTEEIPAKSNACVAAGKPPIDKRAYSEQSDAANALVLGQVDALSADSPVITHAIKYSGNKIESSGPLFDTALYGWPVAKGSPLATVLQAAVKHLIETGKYLEIATNWGVQEGVIKESQINGATN
ncbi:ABC transporter substrate-binding protein [Nocardia sp. NPDC049190]|uniref:ABC transporter substrate-binding protein n=1 Tax=Nocardia sp. NPDC049190 TaxID=3155650 RepID=UPI0033D84C0C